ncbi:MAG: branched-chain amino acid ABC transporter permease [Sporichthyaceae bacterium]
MATDLKKKESGGGHGHGPAPTLNIPPRVGGIAGLLGVHPAILLVVGFAFVYPVLPIEWANEYWTFNVMTGLVLAMACLGLLVVVGWGREISLAQAGLTGSAAYITGFAAREDVDDPQAPVNGWGLPLPFAALVGIGFVVLVSVLVALISMRLAGVYVIVLTLSLQFLLENSLFTEGDLTGGLSPLSTERPEFFGASMESDTRFYYYVLGILLISMYFLHRFRHSRFGRSLIMVGVDKAAAAAVGVSPWMYKVTAFAIAGAFAGLAGAVSAPMYRNPPGILQYISFNSLFYLSVPILAGFESLMAVVGVAVFFQLLPQILLELKINVYLLGGLGLAAGVLAGPRGAGGAVIDMFDPRARAKRRESKGGSGPGGPKGPSGGKPAAKAKSSQLGTKTPAKAGSEKM